jgi:hypothetical protein
MSRHGFLFAVIALLAPTAACSRQVPEESETGPQSQVDVPAIDCRRDISAEECSQAQAALAQDAVASAIESAATAPAGNEHLQDDYARAAAIMATECQFQQNVLAVLKRRERGEGDMLTDDERAQVPAEIQRVQAYLDTNCK